jgi:hypothetical protein
MNLPRTALVLTAALLVAGVTSPNEARAQSHYFSQSSRLPAGRAALVRALLKSPSAERRADAAEELGESGDPRVLDALRTAADDDPSSEVRRAAGRAIRRIRAVQEEFAPRDPNVELVDGWYRRYLGRAADSSGLATWTARLARGASAEDVEAGILASDEFWQLHDSRPEGFISGLYKAVLSRTPRRAEVLAWGRRYVQLRGDRSTLAQEFVVGAQQELSHR